MPSNYNDELGEIDLVCASFGDVPKFSTQRKFGEVLAVSSGTEYSVCYGANPRIPRRTTETSFEIVSSSVNDTSAGTGARTFVVFGYKADFSQTSETVTLNGTNAVALTGSYIAIYRAYVASAGSTACNAGDVTIREVAGAKVVHVIVQALHGQTQMQYYIIPKGKKAQIIADDLSVEKVGGVSANVSIRFLRWNADRTVYREFNHFLLDQSVDDHHHLYYPFGDVFTAGEMIEVTANSTVNNTPVRAVVFFIERDA